MDKQNTKENKQQAIYWRKRLNWYLNEATTEEYDEAEVQAIMDLLPVLDPEGYKEEYYTPEKSLERFWQTYEIRKRIQDEFERLEAGEVSLADYEDEEPNAKKAAKKLPKHFSKFVTAAALVLAMFVGGTIGIYADRDGLFRKLNSGEDRNAIISSVENIGAGSDEHIVYEKIEDVPLKYLRCLWTPAELPDSMKVYEVELNENKFAIKVKCKFLDKKEELFVYTTKVNFKENLVAVDQLFDGFDFLCKEQYDSIEVEYLVKENDDYTEYIALFEYRNSVYSLNSNFEINIIKNMIKESVLNNNL